jgi:aminomethyltransferase
MALSSEVASVRKTALNAVHRQMGAKMVEFNGWDMPVEYPKAGGLVAEHLAVRNSVGIFDVSHMGDIRVAGPEALPAIQKMTMNDASRLAIGQAQYSALLYPEGTFVDDIIVHRMAEDDFLIVINAGNNAKDYDWVRRQAKGFDCTVENLSDNFTQIAIQGPNAVKVLEKLTDADLSQVKFYWFTYGTVCGLPHVLIARTGYTAEDGFEIYIPSDAETSARVWSEIVEAGKELKLLACGLGARNTLRLDRFLKMEKGDFTGRAALEKQRAEGLKRILVGLEPVERGIPRDGYKVFDLAGGEIGFVTSGSPAPFLKKNVALAYVPVALSAPGCEVAVEIRGQKVKCKVIPTPFYKRPKAGSKQA